MRRQPRRIRRPRKTDAKCYFCTEKSLPDYKNPVLLNRYVTDRGKIIARSRTGSCQKHQRLLAQAIKRARHLALMPFTPRVK